MTTTALMMFVLQTHWWSFQGSWAKDLEPGSVTAEDG
jgi:hypothetical protein